VERIGFAGYESAFRGGRTFRQLVQDVDANRDLWRALAQRAPLVQDAAARVTRVPGRWRLLALAEDWCGDAVKTLPIVARLADAASNLELRIGRRDEHPEVMDRHLTGGRRSIPVVILLDERGRARGWWGPRPGPLQAWFEREGRALAKPDRYREMRRWYARDRGATTASEIADLIECGATSRSGFYRGTRPCVELDAA
jgi:hypothetical protein